MFRDNKMVQVKVAIQYTFLHVDTHNDTYKFFGMPISSHTFSIFQWSAFKCVVYIS